jgi:hypothetical protein
LLDWIGTIVEWGEKKKKKKSKEKRKKEEKKRRRKDLPIDRKPSSPPLTASMINFVMPCSASVCTQKSSNRIMVASLRLAMLSARTKGKRQNPSR